MPEWMTTGVFVICVMIVWDIIRIFIQAHVNKWILKKEFDEIDQALDDVEDAIDEENGNGKST